MTLQLSLGIIGGPSYIIPAGAAPAPQRSIARPHNNRRPLGECASSG
jgi:hypothetical protein